MIDGHRRLYGSRNRGKHVKTNSQTTSSLDLGSSRILSMVYLLDNECFALLEAQECTEVYILLYMFLCKACHGEGMGSSGTISEHSVLHCNALPWRHAVLSLCVMTNFLKTKWIQNEGTKLCKQLKCMLTLCKSKTRQCNRRFGSGSR